MRPSTFLGLDFCKDRCGVKRRICLLGFNKIADRINCYNLASVSVGAN